MFSNISISPIHLRIWDRFCFAHCAFWTGSVLLTRMVLFCTQEWYFFVQFNIFNNILQQYLKVLCQKFYNKKIQKKVHYNRPSFIFCFISNKLMDLHILHSLITQNEDDIPFHFQKQLYFLLFL